MSAPHSNSCGRQIALRLELRGVSQPDIAQAISDHCSVSLLRAHRIACGYTLVEVAGRLRAILRDRGIPGEGLAHQTVSRWENGLDSPSERYLDGLCALYKTRPDLLGFGRDYSPGPETEPVGKVLPQVMYGVSTGRAVELLENRAEESGYELYTTGPADFIPARMIDLAGIQGLLLQGQPLNMQRRLHRTAAKNAGFIGIRLTDVGSADETFNWFGIARKSAQLAQDTGMEAWIAGHMSDGHSCYRYSLTQGLQAARLAQAVSGPRPSPAALFSYLAEAGVQARLGRRRETLEAVRQAQRIYDALPEHQIAADGVRIPEYFLRWHQSNALSIVGEEELADPLRRRALELPLGSGDLIGRSLLFLDQAALAFDAGRVDEGCVLVRKAWSDVPDEFHEGQIMFRTRSIIAALEPARRLAREVGSLRESLSLTRN